MTNAVPSDAPLVPSGFTDALAGTYATGATVQSYCATVLAQPDIHLKDVTDTAPAQRMVRGHAAYWLSTLNPAVRRSYARVKGFANLYGTLSNADVDRLVGALGTPEGRAEFAEFVAALRQETERAAGEAAETSAGLDALARSLDADLSGFRSVAAEAHARYGAANTRILQLLDALPQFNDTLRDVDEELLAAGARMPDAAAPPFLLALAQAPTDGAPLVRSTPTTTDGVLLTRLAAQVKAREDVDHEYAAQLAELHGLQPQSAALHLLDDTYRCLARAALSLAARLDATAQCWHALGDGLAGLVVVAEGGVDAGTEALFRTRLTEARAGIRELHAVADRYETADTLPVVCDETLTRLLRLPVGWASKAIDGEVFANFVAERRPLSA
ncbi:HBL/NHE enterotoxin family protein [Streptomyces sp. NPDC001941]|uniref:HBL/NHE enterotoxin family protein n=1 Tax=Streptomyces sp. NPDC001941 TaxID=3154659 RepID=UPI00331A2F51